MKKRIVKSIVIFFVLVSLIFIGTSVYITFDVIGSPFLGKTAKTLVIVLLTFSLCFGSLSFIIMALILRESYKINSKVKNKKYNK